jgi:hypothetical protein
VARRVSVKGKGADLFFGEGLAQPASPATTAAPSELALDRSFVAAPMETPAPNAIDDQIEAAPAQPTGRPSRRRASAPTPATQSTANLSASTLASTATDQPAVAAAPYAPALIEQIRKTVKAPGREVSFVRLTPEEKGHLADLVYTYKRQGIKTSENEINRIAVNYILSDYVENGAESVLARVIAALRA